MAEELVECLHGVWPSTSCTICNGKEKAEDKRQLEAEAFLQYSKYPGHCSHCNESFLAGTEIVRIVNGTYIHQECYDEIWSTE
jgi:hypothetical protein